MRQLLIIFLVCQPAAFLFALCYTFWPAVAVGLQIPQAGLQVAKTIWGDKGGAYLYQSDDGRTFVQVNIR